MDTMAALERSVRFAWNQKVTPSPNTAVDVQMARVAVADVVDALQANPAWAKSLGIG